MIPEVIALSGTIRQEAQEVRKRMEDAGYILSQPEYEAILQYAARKSFLNHKEESYIPLLLEDEIRNYYFRNTINAVSFLLTEAI